MPETLLALHTCGLLFHRGDIFAWLAAACGEYQVAAQVVGAVDEFHIRTEGPRDRLAARARAKALQLMIGRFSASDQHAWTSYGQQIDEAQFITIVNAFVALPQEAH